VDVDQCPAAADYRTALAAVNALGATFRSVDEQLTEIKDLIVNRRNGSPT
jgi:hypothetical protein